MQPLLFDLCLESAARHTLASAGSRSLPMKIADFMKKVKFLVGYGLFATSLKPEWAKAEQTGTE